MQVEELVEKIKNLPPERIAEVEDFVDFITLRDDHRLVQAAAKLSEDSFREVWDNEEDAAYDRL
ncbi:MAG: toxin-antitoxin system, antitoxin component, Xre family protein [Acidobacteria bacterium]|nr:MAG: toxin-antitoxin system, antitoxin component, Xre family protein [Acidobacteriota bacterium]